MSINLSTFSMNCALSTFSFVILFKTFTWEETRPALLNKRSRDSKSTVANLLLLSETKIGSPRSFRSIFFILSFASESVVLIETISCFTTSKFSSTISSLSCEDDVIIFFKTSIHLSNAPLILLLSGTSRDLILSITSSIK